MATMTPQQHAAELLAVAKIAPQLTRPGLTEAADAVLADWQQAYSTIRSKKRIASSLGRWISTGPGWMMAEVGVRKGVTSRRVGGSFAHIIEFGSVNNPPRNDGGEALLRNAPTLEAAMVALAYALLGSSRGAIAGVGVASATLTPGRMNTGYGQIAE